VKTIVPLLLLLIIALGLGVSWHATRERMADESALAPVATERDALRQNVNRERQRLQLARDAQAAVRVGAHSDVAETTPTPSRPLGPEAALARNPALLAEHLRCRAEILEWGSGHLFHAVGFSPGQIEQWKQMIAQDEQRRLDLVAAVEAQGLGRSSETFKTLSAENEKLRRAREAEILGDLAPKYREYQRLEGTRSLVAWLTRTGVYLDEPITGEQIERATHIIAGNSRPGPGAGNREQAAAVDWTTVTAQLQGILSPAQIATLQRVGNQFETVNRAAQRVDERTKLLTAQFKSQPRR
jgi:hypothetical protein